MMRATIEIHTRSPAALAGEFERAFTSLALIVGFAVLFSLGCSPSPQRGPLDIVIRIESFPWYAPLRGGFVEVASDGKRAVLRRVEANSLEQLVSTGETCFRTKDDRLDALQVYVSPKRALETLAELEALFSPSASRRGYRVHVSGDRELIHAEWRLRASDGRAIAVDFGPLSELYPEPMADSLTESLEVEGVWLVEIVAYGETFTRQVRRVNGNTPIAHELTWGALLPGDDSDAQGYLGIGVNPAVLHVLRVPAGSRVYADFWNRRLMSVIVYCPMEHLAQLRETLTADAGPAISEIWDVDQHRESSEPSQLIRSVWMFKTDDWLSTSASLSIEKRENWTSAPAIKNIVDEEKRVAMLALRPVSTVGGLVTGAAEVTGTTPVRHGR